MFRRDPGAVLALLRRALPDARGQAPEPGPRGAGRARAGRAARRGDHPEHRSAARPRRHARADRGARDDRALLLPELRGQLPARRGAARRQADDAPGFRAATAASRSSPTWCCSASTCPPTRWREPSSSPLAADLMLCIGSSLEVYPVAQLPAMTLAAGGQIAILTQGPTPFDSPRGGPAAAATWSTSSTRCSTRWPLERRALSRALRRAHALATARARSAASIRPSVNATVSRWSASQRAARAPPGRPRRPASRWRAQLGQPVGERRRGRVAGAARRGPRRARPAPGARPRARGRGRGRAGRAAPAPRRRATCSRPPSTAASRACGWSTFSRRCRGPRSSSSRASVHRPSATCSPAPKPIRATSAWRRPTGCRYGSAVTSRNACSARLSTVEAGGELGLAGARPASAGLGSPPASGSPTSMIVARPVVTGVGSGSG